MIESGYFMNAIRRSLEMVKGDTLSFGFEVKGLKGQRPEAVQFSCKDKLEDTGYVFAVSLADTIDFRSYDAENDILTYGVRVPPNKTAGIYAGSYFYDLELRVNGDVITLMIGRLQIDEQITNSAVPPSPSYEDGDNTLYPVQDIPEGRKKAYSEQAVSNIATQLEETLDEYLGYKVGDMAPAVETIKFAISNINEATKTLTDSTEDYTLAELAPAIASVTRGDNIYYPVADPQGTKVYREADIDSIGIAIQRLLGTTYKIRPKDMDYAIYSVIPERTKSGAVVSISDGGMETPLSGGKVYVSPVQSGTGTPAPDNVRPISGFTGSTLKHVGKNLVNDKDFTNGLPATIIGSDIETITASTRYACVGVKSPKTNITISCQTSDTSKVASILFYGYVNGKLSSYQSISAINSSRTIDVSAYDYIRITIGSESASVLVPTDLTDYGYLQAEVGSSATEYAQYIEREIAPISWEAEAGTIYAGYKDLKTGKVFATHFSISKAVADMNNTDNYPGWRSAGIKPYVESVSTSYNDALTNVGVGVGINTSGNNDIIYLPKGSYNNRTQTEWQTNYPNLIVQMILPFASPVEYEGDPVSGIYTMLGDNTFFNNTGDTEITYSADITKLVESLD